MSSQPNKQNDLKGSKGRGSGGGSAPTPQGNGKQPQRAPQQPAQQTPARPPTTGRRPSNPNNVRQGPDQPKQPAPAAAAAPVQPSTPAPPQVAQGGQGAPSLPTQAAQPPPQQPPQPQQPPVHHQAHPPAQVNPPHPQQNSTPPQGPPGPNGYPRPGPPTNDQHASIPIPFVSAATYSAGITRTKSAPPGLGEQEKMAAGPSFVPEKSAAMKFFSNPYAPPFHAAPYMHPQYPPPYPPPMAMNPTPPIPIAKKTSSRIPIIDPSTGQEVRVNSPPKGGQPTNQQSVASSVPPPTTPSPTGLAGNFNKPFVPPAKPVSITTPSATTSTTPATTSTTPSSAPQQVKGVVGGILPELTPQSRTPPASTSTPTSDTPSPSSDATPAKSDEPAPPTPSAAEQHPPAEEKKEEKTEEREKDKEKEREKPKAEEQAKAEEKPKVEEKKTDEKAVAEKPKVEEKAEEKHTEKVIEEKPKAEEKKAEEKKEEKKTEEKPKVEEKAKTEENSKAEEKPKVEEKTDEKSKAEEKTEEKPKVEEQPKEEEKKGKKKSSASLKDAIKKADEGKLNAAGFDPYAMQTPKDKEKEKEKDKEKEKEAQQKTKEKEETKAKEEKPATSVPAADAEPATSAPAEEAEEEDWDKKPEESLVVRRDSITSSSDVSLRPGGGKAGGWTEGGKKMYDRNFLLQFQSQCTDRPAGLPPMEVILGYDEGKGSGGFAPGAKRNSITSASPGAPPFPGGNRAKYPPNANDFRQNMGPQGNFPGGAGGGRGGRGGGRGGAAMGGDRYNKGGKPGGGKAILPNPPTGQLGPPLVLVRSVNAWTKTTPANEDEVILKKAKGILNKITLDKFEPLSEQLLDVGITNPVILQGIISQVFDKALSEPKYVNMYAQLCRKISQSDKIPEFKEGQDGKPVTFKRILLNKCQEEFERNQMNASKKEKRDEGMTPEQIAEIEYKEHLARKYYLGNIKFIGELFKLEMLTEKIMNNCVIQLIGDVKNPKEEDMEALCKLMSTIGERLDRPQAQNYMNTYFERVKEITQNPALPSRIRFMLEDLIALRRGKWVPRRDTNAPKTIKEVHKEAAEKEKQQEKEFLRNSSNLGRPPNRVDPRDVRGGGGMGGGGRMGGGPGGNERGGPMQGPFGRGGNQPSRGGGGGGGSGAGAGDDGWEVSTGGRRGGGGGGRGSDSNNPPPGSRGGPSVPTSFAPAGGLGRGWPSSQGSNADKGKQDTSRGNAFGALAQQPGGGGAGGQGATNQPASGKQQQQQPPARAATPPAITQEKAEEDTNSILEEYLQSGDAKEASVLVKELNAPRFHADIINWMLSSVLEKKDREVNMLAALFRAFVTEKAITSEQLAAGIQKNLEFLPDFAVDLPKAPKHLAIIIGGAIGHGQLPLSFLSHSLDHLAEPLAGQVGLEVCEEVSKVKTDAQTEKELWSALSKLFKPEKTDAQLITFVTDKRKTNVFPNTIVRTKIETMIKDGSTEAAIIEWVSNNASSTPVDATLARWLMRTVLQEITPGNENAGVKRYSLLLKRFLSESIDIQLQCLFEVQGYWASIGGSPKEMLSRLFEALYDHDVILEDAFKQWVEDCTDTTPKKADALINTNKWITWLETADEESGEEEETK